jgi:DEAD/DEAH box helicase domain-containing protein
VLDALWSLITTTAARDVGKGVWRLDFSRAAVARIDQAFLCPITRRPFAYSVAGRTPYDVMCSMEEVSFPRLPVTNAGGLSASQRAEVARWCASDPQVGELRRRGIWTDLHDRIASYPPFLRAQEHSAQIPRPVLQSYEERFKEGRINLLNCSTTMEMGVDIPQVSVVVNANVPPSVSNYRQRVGRAGRRGEPWAFGMTFCRDLPMDRKTFDDPAAFLGRPIAPPKVWLDSPGQVARHVNAVLLAAWVRDRGGLEIRASVGSFFGAGETINEDVLPGAPADLFIDDLRGPWGGQPALAATLKTLLTGTALEGRTPNVLAAGAAEILEGIVIRWRAEHRALLDRESAAGEKEVREAFALRARRLRGEFLLSDLARRGFTPAYGFPTDVVSFDHLSGRSEAAGDGAIAFGDRRGGASRSLDMAIREYAPGAEVVVDGLVHLSEGIRPAWGADADVSRLEDFQEFWHCTTCEAFGLAPSSPAECRQCGAPLGASRKVLRPVGFLGRRQPHTGYESLAYVPYEPPRLSAADGAWIALPDAAMGRLRADPEGQVVVLASGRTGGGYAVCLECGRAEGMQAGDGHTMTPLPEAIRRHWPLARGKAGALTQDGFCPGCYTKPNRVQRHVHLMHAARTDVFELQLPKEATRQAALALAAGLREALAERLGLEAREIGPAAAWSRGPAGERRVSAFLHDRAAGGAGFATRLAEGDMFAAMLQRSAAVLNCPESCAAGCPACVLRPDLNLRDIRLDRPGGLSLAETLGSRLNLPFDLRVLGDETRFLGRPVYDWITDASRAGRLARLELYLHGAPSEWDFDGWPPATGLARLAEAGVAVRLVLATAAMTDAGFDLPVRLALHRLAARTELAHTAHLPQVGAVPVIARAEGPVGAQSFAAADAAESVPGAGWGQGAERPVLIGPPIEVPPATLLSAKKLMELGTGNARLLWLGADLDGPLAGFGRRFWRRLADQAPLEIAAMQKQGVARLHYSDRYLLTPLNLALLAEVILEAPGASAAQVTVKTVAVDRTESGGWAAFHVFPDEASRRDVLAALLPRAQIEVRRRRRDLPHFRALDIELRDGRCLRILFDQGARRLAH